MAISESVSFEKIRSRKKISKTVTIVDVFIYTFFVLFAVVTLYPLLHMLALSFDDPYDRYFFNVMLIPNKLSLRNYEMVLFDRPGLRQGMIVTVARTLIGTAMSLFSTALLSFILSRKKFLFKSGLSLFWLITMYAQGGLIPTMILYRYLHLTQSFWVYVIPGLISAFNVMVMKTYMQSIPDSLEESARIEGAGYLRIFWNIITPMCKPVYAAIALFIAVSQWNSWFDAMIYNRICPEYTTMQYEIMKLYSSTVAIGIPGHTKPSPSLYTIRSAAAIVSMLPILIIYPFFQRYFIAGLKFSGVKE